MATKLEASQHALSSDGFACHWPRKRLLVGQINFGPRYDEDTIRVTRTVPESDGTDSATFSLYYRVYNPSSVHSSESPPLIVIHGGPLLPSDYLYPLIHHFPTSRSIIFYDQLGCGRSSQPEDERMFSIDKSVQDLEELIRSLQLKEFHLLGHSFGGIIAYEYLKTNDLSKKCLSLTLNSTPANMQTSHTECSRLECEIKRELMLEIKDKDASLTLVKDRLRKRNECRTEVLPLALATAIKSRGTNFGPEAVSNYVAHPPTKPSIPPVLLIRGQYDFITEPCIVGWRKIFTSAHTNYREEEMMNCAHYCHLEDAQKFGDLIKSHCFIHDF